MSSQVTERNQWYVLRTRSRFEKRVAENLAGRGIEQYLPLIQDRRRWADRVKVVQMPLFPGYVFARFANKEDEILPVLKTPGVVEILGCGGSLEAVPEHQIKAICRLLVSQSNCFQDMPLEQGDPIRVRSGPLRGVEGRLIRFRNGYRLIITIDLISQSIAAEIDISDVERVRRKK